jgi:ABC-2 type transport system ATP-binding protein
VEKEEIINVCEVSKSFRRVLALKDLSISVERRGTFSLLGPNGAGKTTLMKILLGLVGHDAGKVRMQGLPVTSPLSRKGVRYLPENITFPSWASPKVLFRQMERVRREVSAEQFQNRCSELECLELMKRPVGKMSRGQRQRVALSLVTCGDPELVLLDEPSSGLDPGGRILVRNLIRNLSSGGTTILINSHLLGEVERVCDTAAFISRGKLVAQGDLDSLSRHTGLVWVETVHPESMAVAIGEKGYECRSEPRGVTVDLDEGMDFGRLVGRVLDTGIEFTGISRKRESLEDIFLRIMGDEAMEADSHVP